MIDDILRLFREKGQGAYFGENVTELQHALQCAALAESAGASASLVAAALLHDVGHLLHGLGEDIADTGIDGRHESAGATWLSRGFDAAVTDPIRLHVAAKRYLCAVDPTYTASLSDASQLSLRLQGGPFDSEEVARFEQEIHWQAAVLLRRWDDGAKVVGWVVPDLEHYLPVLNGAMRRIA